MKDDDEEEGEEEDLDLDEAELSFLSSVLKEDKNQTIPDIKVSQEKGHSIQLLLEPHLMKKYKKADEFGFAEIDFKPGALTDEELAFGKTIYGKSVWKGVQSNVLIEQFPPLKRLTQTWEATDHLSLSEETRKLIKQKQVNWESAVLLKKANFYSRIGHYADYVKRFFPDLYQYGMFFEKDLIARFILFLNESAGKKGATIRHHCGELMQIVEFELMRNPSNIKIVGKCTVVVQ
jgi:hypothetical protein